MNTKDNSIKELKRFDAEVARAIRFLVDVCLDKEGIQKPLKTDKPLVMHSFRVAFELLTQGYDKEIVIAAILHDLLEDAGVKISIIKDKFGSSVARIVAACSFDETISNEEEKYKELFNRVKAEGRDALIVKTADILDNSNYFQFGEGPLIKKQVLEKWNYFLSIAKVISDELIYQELLNKIRHLNKK